MGCDRPEGANRSDRRLRQAPADGVDPAWLRLRNPADARARSSFGSGLVDALADHLVAGLARRRTVRDDGPEAVRLVDVGAGTGSGAQWLRDRLADRFAARLTDRVPDGPGVRQHWRLVDHDSDLLVSAAPAADGWARGVVATVDDLPKLLDEEPADVITCQALVDVLTANEVDAMLAPAVGSDAAVLLALSVTGEVVLSPLHHDDEMVAAAFDAHQRRAGRLGPDGGAYAAHGLRRQGYTVTVATTPWRLGADDTDLLRAWLQGRAEAAGEQEPDLRERVRDWHESRDRQARHGELTAVVGHVDVLGLPPRPARSP